MPNQEKEQTRLEHIMIDEEPANVRKVNEWLLPLLKSNLTHKSFKEIVLLSVGCRFGVDVDTLVDLGVNAYGVEPFSGTEMWRLRKNKERFTVADGRELPFGKEVFDVVYCSAVLEHVGYEENEEIGRAMQEREKFARELTRVLKPGGIIIITTPNRYFCMDTGHGANFLGIRVHSPFNDFTLSLKEIKSLFLQKSGCRDITTLPYRNFVTWDIYIKNYRIIRLFYPLIKIYFRLLDRLKFLRSSFLSPYLILAIEK
ncbi:class I SAM-dependent methyltransferase [Chloroflexota bacterium]